MCHHDNIRFRNAAAGSDTSDSGPDDDDGSNQWGLTASQELFQSQSKWGSAGAPLQAKARGSGEYRPVQAHTRTHTRT